MCLSELKATKIVVYCALICKALCKVMAYELSETKYGGKTKIPSSALCTPVQQRLQKQ